MDPTKTNGRRGRLLKRSDVARRLGVTTTTVRRLEGDVLHPQLGADGMRLFGEDEVERVAHSRSVKPAPEASGEVAAEAFRLFHQGYELEEIVMRLRQQPTVIRRLFDQWCSGLLDRS